MALAFFQRWRLRLSPLYGMAKAHVKEGTYFHEETGGIRHIGLKGGFVAKQRARLDLVLRGQAQDLEVGVYFRRQANGWELHKVYYGPAGR